MDHQEVSVLQPLDIRVLAPGLADVTSVDGSPRGFCPAASGYTITWIRGRDLSGQTSRNFCLAASRCTSTWIRGRDLSG
jgi:hypothetical protein